MNARITGTGSIIPDQQVPNSFFLEHEFLESNGTAIKSNNSTIIEKFAVITGIQERRYAQTNQVASDLGFIAAQRAIEAASIDKEKIDYIIVAHNFGDVDHESNRVNMVPALASKIKALLQIHNPDCVAYDLPFGCPGWVEGVIQANYFIKSGDAKCCLVIGTETLSRVIDPHDRDSMIFSDGAGAVVLQASADEGKGILAHKTQSHAVEFSELIRMDHSFGQNGDDPNLYLKMSGRKVYEFALNHVPIAIKLVLDKAGLHIKDVQQILIHQANEKMDNAIAERLFNLYGIDNYSNAAVPMTIGFLGNSSVATVPTMLDLILRGQLEGHKISPGDKIVMASVGAGMNINAIVYGF